MKPLAKIALAGVLAAAPVAAFAHHGWSSYNEAEPFTLTGPLSNVSWGNPHGTATMNWRNQQWDVVLAPTSRMTARGLSEGAINQGQRITLTGYIRTDGTPEMRVERIRVDGQIVELR